jgi:hypothetical protein
LDSQGLTNAVVEDEVEAEVEPIDPENPDKRGLALVVDSNPPSDSKLPVPLLFVEMAGVATVEFVIPTGSSSAL